MEVAPAGVSLSFEVTYDSPSLYVGMSVYDDSGASPVLIQGPTAMSIVVGNTYRAKFIGDANKPYVIVKRVYTNVGMTVVDPNYSAGSESIYCEDAGSSGGILSDNDVIGFIDTSTELIGFVSC
jgi:hypothetical protein